jgi:hypothetical protein
MPTKLPAIVRPDGRAVRRIGVSAAAVALLMLLVPAPAQAGDRWSETCVASWGVFSCVEQWGPPGSIAKVIQMPAPRDDQDANASADRDRRWAVRCRPTSHVDRYGVRRLYYAAPGCEFGRHED